MHLFEDIRFGVRGVAKNKGFTAAAIIALALGIGANATVFAIVNDPGRIREFVPLPDDLPYGEPLLEKDAVPAK